MEVTRHFTATVFIVHAGCVLLHYHKRQKKILPVGGHIDRDELPEETAVREAREEAGLDITLYQPDPTEDFQMQEVRGLIKPAHMLLETINPYHEHIDAIFYATTDTDELKPQDGESEDLKWYSKEDLQQKDIPNDVRVLALEALSLLS